MALSIHTENNIYTITAIPLEWENVTILANHFRMLADEIESIESSNLKVIGVRLNAPVNDNTGKTMLELVSFAKQKY